MDFATLLHSIDPCLAGSDQTRRISFPMLVKDTNLNVQMGHFINGNTKVNYRFIPPGFTTTMKLMRFIGDGILMLRCHQNFIKWIGRFLVGQTKSMSWTFQIRHVQFDFQRSVPWSCRRRNCSFYNLRILPSIQAGTTALVGSMT